MLEHSLKEYAPSGMALIPALSWGSHIGQFYRVATDLRDVLVPYFRAGLENNERCLWVTDAPFGLDDARAALRTAVPDLDWRERRGQIEIQDTRTFYDPDQPLQSEAIVSGLLQREQKALAAGYRGLRTNGNCGWADKARWNRIVDYESHVNRTVPGRRLICMCSYCHDRIGHAEVSDIIERHHFILRQPGLDGGEARLANDIARKLVGATIGSSYFDFQPDLDAAQALSDVPTILKTVCRVTGMGFVAVARVTSERWVCLAVHDGIGFGLKPGDELPVATTLCHEVRQARDAVVINRVEQNAAYINHQAPSMYGFQSYISMPIFLRDSSFYGTLCALDPEPAKLHDPAVIGTFRTFADLIGFQLEASTSLATVKGNLAEAIALNKLKEQASSFENDGA
jgi:GAF domain-containing protein